MALTDTAIRAAGTRDRRYKLFDERGLYLLVEPSGGKLWRLKYRFGGKEKKLALGSYPATSLKEAREKRDEARKLLDAGKDPSAQRRQERLSRAASAHNTFEAVAEEFIGKKQRERQAPITIRKARWLLKQLAAKLGSQPINEITPPELLRALRAVEARGNLETARRMRSFAGRVFRYAIATGRAERDLSADLRDALTAPTVTHRAAILDPKGVGELLRAVESYEGQISTVLALKLAPHVFVRPGELRRAEWKELDFEKAVWVIPADKMKMGRDHQVPLSRQALAILAEARKHSQEGYIFPSASSPQRPISENTLNGALRRMGFGSEQMTAHGFRAIASTLLNESGKWHPDAIERALAHGDRSAVRAAYHRGAHWDERVAMAQWWSNYLDELRTGAAVFTLSWKTEVARR